MSNQHLFKGCIIGSLCPIPTHSVICSSCVCNQILTSGDKGGADGLMLRWTDGLDTCGSSTPVQRNGSSTQSTWDTFLGERHRVHRQDGLIPYLNWCPSAQVAKKLDRPGQAS